MIMRQTEEAVELSGTTIPAGATCILMLAAANRDERHFARPRRVSTSRGPDLDVAKAFSRRGQPRAVRPRPALLRRLAAGPHRDDGRLDLVLDRLPGLRYQEGFPPARPACTPAAWRACSSSSTPPA
jgi:pulcherriminic acid synthase